MMTHMSQAEGGGTKYMAQLD